MVPEREAVASAWATVLKLDSVAYDEDFFDAGGDSLGGVRVAALLKRAGYTVTAADLDAYPTVRRLAQHLRAGAVASVDSVDKEAGAAPILPIHHRFEDWRFDEPNHYNIAVLFTVDRAVDRDRLGRAVTALATRHEALRARFDFTSRTMRTSDDVPALEVEATADVEHSVQQLQLSLDVARGPVCRMVLLETGGDTDRLLLLVHHLVCDGLSLAVLTEELQALYARGAGATVLPPASRSYLDHARGLARWTDDGGARRLSADWLALPWSALRVVPVCDVAGHR